MQAFPIAPASLKAVWVFLPAIAIPVVIIPIIILAVISGTKARFEVSQAGLRISGDFYGRTIPIADIRGGAAKRVDIGVSSEFQPVRRTLGTGLPGYRAGWFRLRDGEKALAYITDSAKAVYVPTRTDFAILLTPDDPDGFLAAIREVAPGQ